MIENKTDAEVPGIAGAIAEIEKRNGVNRAGAFTCRVSNLGDRKTPNRIKLLGDKAKPESAQHVIEFPGGAIEVSRTTDGNYWAHIIVNRGWADSDCDGLRNSVGEIVGARIDSNDGGVHEVPSYESISQIALLIHPKQ